MLNRVNLENSQMLGKLCALKIVQKTLPGTAGIWVTALSPNFYQPPELKILGQFYFEKGEWKNAEILYSKLLELDLTNLEVRHKLIEIYKNEGLAAISETSKKIAESLASIKEGNLPMTEAACIERGKRLLKRGEEENNPEIMINALAEFIWAAQLNSSSAQALLYLGCAYGALAGLEGPDWYFSSLRIFRKHLQKFPADPEGHLYLGKTLCNLKKFSEAEKHFQIYIDKKGENLDLHFSLTGLYFGQGNYPKAIECLTKALEIESGNPSLYQLLGVAGFQLENFEDAEINFKRALGLDPEQPICYQLLAQIYYKQNKYPEALEMINQYLQFNWFSRAETLLKAKILIEMGILKKARKFLNRAQRLGSGAAEILCGDSQILIKEEKFSQAEERLKLCLEADPKNHLAKLLLGWVYLEVGKIEESLAVYTEIEESYPADEILHLILSKIYLLQGKTEAGLSQLESALAANPDQAELHYNLGLVLKELGRLEEACAHFGRAEAVNFPGAEAERKKTFKTLNLIPGYLKMLESETPPGFALYELATIYLSISHWPAAEELLSRYLRQEPDNVWARIGLGEALFRQAKFEQAVISFMAVVPKDNYNLRALEFAEQLFKKFENKFGDNPEFKIALAKLYQGFASFYQRFNNPQEAAAYYEMAQAICPEN